MLCIYYIFGSIIVKEISREIFLYCVYLIVYDEYGLTVAGTATGTICHSPQVPWTVGPMPYGTFSMTILNRLVCISISHKLSGRLIHVR
jgi:hypothetical protein